MAYDPFPVVFDEDRLLAAVHWICANSDARELGRVKLHKILYFADMIAFRASGTPLTGVEYQRQPFGPTARHLGWALDRLQADAKISVSDEEYWGFRKFVFRSLKAPEVGCFSNEEIDLLHEVKEFVCGRSAREISELTHEQPPWRLMENGETIPYESAFLMEPVESEDGDDEWAMAEADNVVAQFGSDR